MKAATVLLRQVHPTWMQDGVATSLAFKPSKKDSGVLSTYDGSKIDAAAAWRHYTTKMELGSHGVVGVSVSECEECELKVIADGIPSLRRKLETLLVVSAATINGRPAGVGDTVYQSAAVPPGDAVNCGEGVKRDKTSVARNKSLGFVTPPLAAGPLSLTRPPISAACPSRSA